MKRPLLRCALVGADTLLIECARLVLERGHEIATIAAGSTRIADWAAQAGIPTRPASEIENWDADLKALSIDHLFAITHLALLPSKIVSAVGGPAINFHDGPLPQYAGLNTPVWGILRNEREWGITWHRIEDGIDNGDVLVQRRFAIAERETALSLNTRNFEEAIESFSEVLDKLESAHAAGRPVDVERQDPHAPRSVFRRSDRPDSVLDFSQPAADVDRVVRALHFGPHPNPVAAATLWHSHAAVIAESSEIVELSAPEMAGTLLAADSAGLTIACSIGAVRLTDLRWLDGRRCAASEFVETCSAAVGHVLPQLSTDQRQWLAEFAASNQRKEASIVAALSALTPAEFPWPHRAVRSSAARSVMEVALDAPRTPAAMTNALATLLARLTPGGGRDVAMAVPLVPDFARPLIASETVVDVSGPAADTITSWQRDLLARTASLAGRPELIAGVHLPIGIRLSRHDEPLPHALVVLQPSATGEGWEVEFDASAIERSDVAAFARCLATTASPDYSAGTALLGATEREHVVHQLNNTGSAFELACVHHLIEQQAAKTPQREAVVCGDDALSYQGLLARSKRLATHLQQLGVGPDVLVGVHVERSIDLVVAVLGVLQAGGAYVPLDPAYPAHRLQHMISDSAARVIVCDDKDRRRLPLPVDGVDRTIVAVDDAREERVAGPSVDRVQPHNLAYCIYTSGSAGAPKGVLVEHGNVANFFAAMDSVIQRCPDQGGGGETWCAVTSLSFDISVLELLYTLARGIRIALYAPNALQPSPRTKAIDFSLFYFAADEAVDENDAGGKYRLLLDGARFADANGFSAVWTPERHFHAFGGLYPNPAVTAAAIAMVTERISIRAGSVVLPLHHPVEIAETWSMVDNLSNGRAGVAFANGWQPNDFVLRPDNYARTKAAMFEGIEQIRRLWRGETLTFEGPNHSHVEVATLPRPVQPELPTWITTAGDPDSFAAAGKAGANLLTHLVGQSIEQLATKIASYRTARSAAGYDPSTGVVTLMLHTFVGDDEHAVRSIVREPLRNYLNTSFNLIREHAWSFPTFRRPDGARIGNPDDLADDDIANLAGDDLAAVLDFAADRYYETSGLFGTPEQVVARVEQLQAIGVDEVACLVDFGIATDTVLAHLPHLAHARMMATRHDATSAATDTGTAPGDAGIAELIATTGTTHMQCTPSMARMLTHDPATRAALGSLHHLLVGGEALAPDLAHELQQLVAGSVTNMYGPTETTVWSSAWTVQPGFDWTPIGTPIANTQLYVLDNVGQPTPPGVAGQLWIGGEGVARGYHRQPELTEQRFRANSFTGEGRIYDTGDLARWRQLSDGSTTLEFLGRSDQQVKLRGHRIELGEIESEMRRLAGVLECAAVIREGDDHSTDQQLVAYVVASDPSFDTGAVRAVLRTRLPEVMVPSHVGVLQALPRTPNGKVDRRALATQTPTSPARPAPAPAEGDTERLVLASWYHVLGDDALGVDDNFFDVGGHSLLVVRLQRDLQEKLARTIALTDLYRFPTVRAFAASLTSDGQKSMAVAGALDRAARRRATSRGRS